jgi:hypothetical protein
MKFTVGEVLEYDCPFTTYKAFGDDFTTYVPVWDWASWQEGEETAYDAGGIGKCTITIEEVFPSKTGADIVVSTRRFYEPSGDFVKIKRPRHIQRVSHLKSFITKMENTIAHRVFAKMNVKSKTKGFFDEAASNIKNYF